jgi:hypothetical protein
MGVNKAGHKEAFMKNKKCIKAWTGTIMFSFGIGKMSRREAAKRITSVLQELPELSPAIYALKLDSGRLPKNRRAALAQAVRFPAAADPQRSPTRRA